MESWFKKHAGDCLDHAQGASDGGIITEYVQYDGCIYVRMGTKYQRRAEGVKNSSFRLEAEWNARTYIYCCKQSQVLYCRSNVVTYNTAHASMTSMCVLCAAKRISYEVNGSIVTIIVFAIRQCAA